MERLARVLRAVEWQAAMESETCPVCGAWQECGHADGCELAAVLDCLPHLAAILDCLPQSLLSPSPGDE